MKGNLFYNLFKYRPRPTNSPKENFLTEAFAFVLNHDTEAQETILSLIGVDSLSAVFSTQDTVSATDGTSVCADMVARVESQWLLFEHKWDSPVGEDQLQRYRRVADEPSPSRRVVFIGKDLQQKDVAKPFCDHAFTWGDVHLTLSEIDDPGVILAEFTAFLDQVGLSMPEPLSIDKLRAYSMGRDVPAACKRLARKLAERKWTSVPGRFSSPEVSDSWGRTGLYFRYFNEKAGKPALFMGFYLDSRDHKFDFVDPKSGPDLMLAIDADPKSTSHFAANDRVMQKVNELKTGDLARHVYGPGETINNLWRKIVLRTGLADVIDGLDSEEDQVNAIYQLLDSWCSALFEDGKLEQAFIELQEKWGES